MTGCQAGEKLDAEKERQAQHDDRVIDVGELESKPEKKCRDETECGEHSIRGQDQCQAFAHRRWRAGR